MLSGKTATLYVVALGAGFVVLGCLSPPNTAPPPPPRPQAKRYPVPEMRIPVDAVAQANNIPVVPLPPVPRASSEPSLLAGKPDAPLNPILPVSATLPPVTVAPPPSSTIPPPPAPPPFILPDSSPGGPSLNPSSPPVVKPSETTTTPVIEKGDLPRQLQRQAAQTYAGLDSYIARLTRREVVAGKAKPEEVILFKFRKEPWSIYFKWLGEEGKGREVIYVKGRYENKIHTLLANGDMPALLMPSDHRMALAVDSSLVRSASRHSITEAGIGHCIAHIGQVLDAQEHGDKKLGTIADLGLQQRPEYPKPLPTIEHTIPPGVEEALPRGGKRRYGFDPESHLPLLIITRDDRGQEVEYYRHDRLQFPVKLDDDDFNPDKLWKPATRPASH